MGALEKKLPVGKSPFLARAAIPRTGQSQIPGRYSADKDMWVVETSQGLTPIIAEGALAELLTKTKTHNEQDDDSFMLETITKTFQHTEGDDDSSMGESQSPVHVSGSPIANDRGRANSILELITKTNVELERDDNGDPSMGMEARFYED